MLEEVKAICPNHKTLFSKACAYDLLMLIRKVHKTWLGSNQERLRGQIVNHQYDSSTSWLLNFSSFRDNASEWKSIAKDPNGWPSEKEITRLFARSIPQTSPLFTALLIQVTKAQVTVYSITSIFQKTKPVSCADFVVELSGNFQK
jgi:hypothetical protein